MNTQTTLPPRSVNLVLRCLACLALLAGLGWVIPANHVMAGGGNYEAGEVIVQLAPLSGATIEDIDRDHNTKTFQTFEPGSGIYLLQTPAGSDPEVSAKDLALDPRLSFAELNSIIHPPEANSGGISRWGGLDPTPYPIQYAADQLNLAQAWNISRGAGTVVAVLDTGVQLDHPALASSIAPTGYDFIDNDNIPQDTFNGTDSNGNGIVDEAAGHGTHVAGIIHLVAPDAKIMPLRVLDSDGNGDIFTLAQAMIYAIQNHANVINLSLGTPVQSNLIAKLVRAATRNNIVVVAAAGNLNSMAPQYPAADNCVLSVTAVGPDGIKSDFANFGRVDFAASGESIYSTFPQDGYAYWSGTSMAAPFVAGQAALIHSARPRLNPRDLASLIGKTSHSLNALNPLYARNLGMGLVDIGNSLMLSLNDDTESSENHGVIGESCVQ